MKRVVFAAAATVLLFAATAASAVTVDGLSVTFNALPGGDVTSGLDVSSLSPGAHYGGFSSTGVYSNAYYGQTNPFEYLGAHRDDSTPAFDAVYNGAAYYDYTTPLESFSILWGSVDPSNGLTFFNSGHVSLGGISGADLLSAIVSANLPSSEISGNPSLQPTVDITVATPTGTEFVGVSGSPDLTFEYSNIVVTQATSAAPEPTTWLMLLVGFAGVGGLLRRGHRTPEADVATPV